MSLPDQPTTPTIPQAAEDAAARQQVQRLMAAVDEAIVGRMATSFRDPNPVPLVGSASPVAQPGRPPMSQKATDASALMLSGSVLTAVVGGSVTAILWASGGADPTVVAMVFGAPAALVLALSRLMKRAKDVLPDEHHHHYDGPVYQDQRNVHTSTRGVWAKTTNQQ